MDIDWDKLYEDLGLETHFKKVIVKTVIQDHLATRNMIGGKDIDVQKSSDLADKDICSPDINDKDCKPPSKEAIEWFLDDIGMYMQNYERDELDHFCEVMEYLKQYEEQDVKKGTA